MTWCEILHLSISKRNSSVQKMVRNFAYIVIGSADLCHCKQGNSKKTCQSIIAKSKPKATNYECGECIIPSVLCWISSSCGVRFFSASLSLIPVVTSFSFNFCWASEDHYFWVFSTLSVYRWASKNLFGKIHLACFKPKWKWLRGGTRRRTILKPFEPPGLKVMRESMHVRQVFTHQPLYLL